MRDGRPSETAIIIAGGIALVAHAETDSQLVGARELELTERLLASSLRGRLVRTSLRTRPGRLLARAIESISVRGTPLHWVLRKRCIEDDVRAAITRGTRQVVILGGGLDTLSVRLAETDPSLSVIEIDHPATHARKAPCVRTLAGELPNLHLLPGNLEHASPGEVLSACRAFDPTARTAFVAEGLLMYLSPQRVGALLAWVGSCAPGSTLAMTSLGVTTDGRVNFDRPSRIADAFLRLRGESFTWGEERASLAVRVAPLGLELVRTLAHDELATSYLQGRTLRRPQLARGEYVALLRVIERTDER